MGISKREDFVESHRRAIQYVKEELVKRNEGNIDLPAQCMVWFNDGSSWGGQAGPLCMGGTPPPYVQMTAGVKALIMKLAKEHDRIVRPIAFVCGIEGFYESHDPDDPVLDQPRDPRPMQQRFAEDLETTVVETVASYYVQDDGMGGIDFWSVISPYSVSDGGVLVWHEDKEIISIEDDGDKKQGGGLYEALIALIKEYQT